MKKRYDKSDVFGVSNLALAVVLALALALALALKLGGVVWWCHFCLDSGRAIFFSHNWPCRDVFIVRIYDRARC